MPYVLEDETKPHYDQEINGIVIGPTVENAGHCPVDEWAALSRAEGSTVEINPHALPPGASTDEEDLTGNWTALCNGDAVAAEAVYTAEPNEADMERVEAGEIRFFEARHGFRIRVVRELEASRPPTHQIGGIPAERFEAATVAGLPAVIGRPLFEEGWGSGVVAVWDAETSVLTVVEASMLTVEEMVAVVEGVLR